MTRYVKGKIKFLIDLLFNNKAEDIVLLDLRNYNAFTSWFLIATSQNPKHSSSIADLIDKSAKSKGYRVCGIEGKDDGKWVVMDYTDVIIHIFTSETRSLYSLDRIWGNAKVYRMNLKDFEDKPNLFQIL